jgi:hypothetical protein
MVCSLGIGNAVFAVSAVKYQKVKNKAQTGPGEGRMRPGLDTGAARQESADTSFFWRMLA